MLATFSYTGAEESAIDQVQDDSQAKKEPIQTPAQDAVDELEAVPSLSDEEEHDKEESEDVPAEDTEYENEVADTEDEEQVQGTQENEGTYLVKGIFFSLCYEFQKRELGFFLPVIHTGNRQAFS